MKLTKHSIGKLKAPTGEVDEKGRPKQLLYWDDELKGFGVLCSGVTKTKSYVVQRGVNGRKRRITLGTVAEFEASKTSIEEVRAKAARTLVDMREGKDPRARWRGELTLKQWRDEYLEARPNLSERTRETYETAIAHFEPWLDGPIRELTPERLEKAYRAIKAKVAGRQPKSRKKKRPDLFVSEPGAAAANTALRVLRSVWIFAQSRDPERVPPWPSAWLRGQWFPVGRRERHVRAEDLKAFYDAVNALDDHGGYRIGRLMRDYVLLLLFTGMRRDEAKSLRWQDVDLGADVIRVSAFRTKAKRRLDLPMSEPVRELLAARRDLGVEDEFVFSSSGDRGHMEEPKKAFASISARCGFKVNPHALRSTFETVAHDVPMPPFALKGLINHAVSNDVTAGYVQLTTESLRKPAQDVGRRIAELCGIQSGKRQKRT